MVAPEAFVEEFYGPEELHGPGNPEVPAVPAPQQQPRPKRKRGGSKNERKSEMEKELLTIEKKKLAILEGQQEDEHSLFLRSLAPYFKKLNSLQQLRIRSKLQNILADKIAKWDNPLPSTSYAVLRENEPTYFNM